MFMNPAITATESNEMLHILRNTFEEGAFIVTVAQLEVLIDSIRDDEGNVVFDIEDGGNTLVFEMDGNIHRVNLIIRSDSDSSQTFTF